MASLSSERSFDKLSPNGEGMEGRANTAALPKALLRSRRPSAVPPHRTAPLSGEPGFDKLSPNGEEVKAAPTLQRRPRRSAGAVAHRQCRHIAQRHFQASQASTSSARTEREWKA